MTITCKFCSKSLRLEDIVIKEYVTRKNLETCGIITIEKKGNVVVADKVHCGGIVVRGRLKGQVISRGPMLVSPEADIRGDVTAPTLAVGAGAVLEGQYEIGQPTPEANGSGDAADAANRSGNGNGKPNGNGASAKGSASAKPSASNGSNSKRKSTSSNDPEETS